MKNLINRIIFGSSILVFSFYGCKKEEVKPIPVHLPNTSLALNIDHNCDGAPLLFDTLNYQNLAGIKYSATRLEYYISGIRLFKGETAVFTSSQIAYMNGRNNNQKISIPNLPVGNYTGIQFYIGIAPAQNISNSLDNTPENINMQWPEVIGGGYHYLKFEGRYLDSANVNQGFTMHIGTNEMLVEHHKILYNFSVEEAVTKTLNLSMNVNEWFKNPYTYNFNKDGNYTMAIPALMTILKNNGYDTFSIKE
ncbi:MAG: MbnP family protein [bacterium]|nr:MbnP family protein [bacterium]